VLPPKLNSILYFTESEMKLLDGTTIQTSGVARRQRAQQTFEALQKELKGKCCEFTYNDWRWALSIVTSRQVDLLDEKQQPFSTVVPYFDFFNHADSKEEKWSFGYKAENKFFHAETIKSVRKGFQVFQFYGPFSNAWLLMDYGFMIEDNSFSSVVVEPKYLGINPDDDLFEFKKKLIKEYINKPDKLLIMKNSVSQELLSAAQIIIGTEEDFKDGKLVKNYGAMTDFLMAQFFQAVLGHKLQQYPNTLKEDEDMMKTSIYTGMSARARMAIALRVEEKRLLQFLIEVFAKKEQKYVQMAKQKLAEEDKQHDEL